MSNRGISHHVLYDVSGVVSPAMVSGLSVAQVYDNDVRVGEIVDPWNIAIFRCIGHDCTVPIGRFAAPLAVVVEPLFYAIGSLRAALDVLFTVHD